MPTMSLSRKGMRQPQDSNAAVDMLAANTAPTAEPSRMPAPAPHAVSAPIKPPRPSGARSTRNTIELVYSPPTESPCTMRNSVSAAGAKRPSVAYPGNSPIRKVGIAMATTEKLSDRILMREELPADRRREVAVDRKIVPFEHVTDHARGDHSTCLRGIHLSPQPVGILQT